MEEEEVKNFKRVCVPEYIAPPKEAPNGKDELIISDESDDDQPTSYKDDGNLSGVPFNLPISVNEKKKRGRHVRDHICILNRCQGPHYNNMNQLRLDEFM